MAAYDKNDKCMICGGDHIYSESVTRIQCMFCGEFFYTNLLCENGHYVCDDCHLERSLEMITSVCGKTAKKEAVSIAYELMTNRWVKIHGREHHYLVAAVLLTAFKNRGYGTAAMKSRFMALLDEAKNRVMKIADNPCGYWGCAGEALGCGVFASLILNATHMSVRERGDANLITAKALEQIAACGGPRCSKRDSFIAILTASQFAAEHWQTPLSDFETVECIFYNKNADCIRERCPFFPEGS